MDLEFVDEPPPPIIENRAGAGITQRFALALKDNPGRWAKYPGKVSSTHSISVYRQNFPQLEWAGRTNPDGGCDVYARYVA